MKPLHTPSLRWRPIIQPISFVQAAELFGVTAAQLRKDFRRSAIELPPVLAAPLNTEGPPSSAGWYDLKVIKRWRAAFTQAQQIAVSD